MSTSPSVDELLARHLSGMSSVEDDQAVARWVESSDANRIEYERLLAAWKARSPAQDFDVDRAWSRVASQLASQNPQAAVLSIRRARRWQPVLLRLAAAVVLIVGAAFLWQRLSLPEEPTIYATADGERRAVTLPDGSLAMLGPGTTLRVPAEYGRSSRQLHLEGEAWFSAQHDDAAPLTVLTANYVIRDVGTEFTISARDAEFVHVAVIAGSVAVRAAAAPESSARFLVAGDVGRFTKAGEVSILTGQTIDSLPAWPSGVLEVEDASVQQVLTKLSQWYGTSITLADSSLATRPITATLSLTSLDDALDVLSLLLGVTPDRAGPGIVLR